MSAPTALRTASALEHSPIASSNTSFPDRKCKTRTCCQYSCDCRTGSRRAEVTVRSMSADVGTLMRSSAFMSHTLVVQYWTQHARHLHEIPLRAQDGFDGLVRGWSFVAQPVGETVVVPNAVHLAAQLSFCHLRTRGGPTQRATGTVRARAEGCLVPSAFDVEAGIA